MSLASTPQDAQKRHELRETFTCFGCACTILIADGEQARSALMRARERLRGWHHQFSRFEPGSELSRINADPRETVPASPTMLALADAIAAAGALTGGLVDATMVAAIERAGYTHHLEGPAMALDQALAQAPPRRPAAPSPRPAWRELRTDWRAGTLTRPPGVRLDSGGIAKGLFADLLGRELAAAPSYAVDCGGDIRFGGTPGVPREIQVASPFDATPLHTFTRQEGAAATSGIGRRLWLDADGRAAHHLLDPATGTSAFTGLVQVTALASTATTAEALAKAALLAGPDAAPQLLRAGGVLVFDDGSHRVLDGSDIGATRLSRAEPMLEAH